MKDAQVFKPIPYGVADFFKIRQGHYYYVDKTRFIKNIEEKGNYLFFIRPRRFGKSLFLSTLESYYDIAYKEDFDSIFKGTDIYNTPTETKNSFMILKMNFSKVDPSPDKVEDSFIEMVINDFIFFVTRYKKYLDIDKNAAISRIQSQKSAADVLNTLITLCKEKEHRLYIIIDEYDNFANTILSEAGESEFKKITHGSGFLRAFFYVLKAGTSDSNAPISRLFMTGVSPITLDDVTSGFNIASSISLDTDLNEMLGFTQADVEEMIEYYRQTGKIVHSTHELMEIMCQWYNHYKFSVRGVTELYNTDQVLYFMQEYMKESLIPGNLVDRNARIDYGKLHHLIIIDQEGVPGTNGNFSKLREIMENGEIHSDIETGFPIDEIANPANFVSLLYYFGLLTIRGLDDENTPVLTIPNELVKQLYYDYISKTYKETGILSIDSNKYKELIKGMAFRGNWKEAVEYISGRMSGSLSISDLLSGEKAHQVFWNVYLGLNTLYCVHPEKEMNQGYADLVLEPVLANNPGIKFSYIIEIKYIKPTEYEKEGIEGKIESLRKEGESQLIQYGRDDKFLKTIGQTTLKKLILIFSGNRLVYSGEV